MTLMVTRGWMQVPELGGATGSECAPSAVYTRRLWCMDITFASRSARAVLLLGGTRLVLQLVRRIVKAHADASEVVEGDILEAGMELAYAYDAEAATLVIHDAELVGPGQEHPAALVRFFADIWRARALHSASVSARFGACIETVSTTLAAQPWALDTEAGCRPAPRVRRRRRFRHHSIVRGEIWQNHKRPVH